MKQFIRKAAVLALISITCLKTFNHAYNGPPPVSVEILQPKLGADGNVVKDASGQDQLESVSAIRFSRWSEAFTFPQSTPNPGFQATDKDRFYVRTTSPQSPGIKVGTSEVTGLLTSETEDLPVSTGASRVDASSDVWKSYPQLLVTDHEDDATYNDPATSDNQSTDSTHVGSFGAKVRVLLPGLGAGVEAVFPVVQPKGEVTVTIRVLGEQPALTPDELQGIYEDFIVARQIYAQIGVKLNSAALCRSHKALR